MLWGAGYRASGPNGWKLAFEVRTQAALYRLKRELVDNIELVRAQHFKRT